MTKQVPKIKDYPVITLNVTDIKKDPTNPNNMTLEQINGLEKSIVNFGRLKYIVVDQDNILIDGEHRLEVEKANGTTKVQVIQVPVKNEIERKMMRETLNQLHGDYDKQKQSSELLAIFENQKLDELAELLGKPREEFENLITRYNPEISFVKEEDESKLPSIFDTESFVKRGEIWQLGRHRLICGDAHNDIPILLENIKPDLLLTDPPYGVSIINTELGTIGGAKPVTIGYLRSSKPKPIHIKDSNHKPLPSRQYRAIEEDDKPFNPTEFIGLAKNHIFFGGNYFADKLPVSSGWLIWLKKHEEWDRTTFADCELMWSDFEIPARVYSVTWMGIIRQGDHSQRVHPTQKPTSLLTKLIKDFTSNNNIILDPFIGSGSTIIACEQTNRICYGMEIDEHYCSVIIRRWEEYTNQKASKLVDRKAMEI